ncbi:hypothetical protein Rsub_08840 [Raphidocelis subcapitata]|uniref:Protein SDA1 n=1 Tax=Raphidocelis subcapitata TaxID=307507 RepID=A0A2V0PG36_9CHLO|nr:hypothetical protein Rsub_08840 [Raphidocelis subcapitata]|eukprot:GBF96025.1 hypothetical protein Rsub_08840 [Raphidocelis subcapitata]
MAYTGTQLLTLQSNIKKDPDGYRDEFLLQVSQCYPRSTSPFAPELMSLLDEGGPAMEPALRRAAVAALILLRNRGQLAPAALLPLLFRLFRVNDKALRDTLSRHIISDLRAANRGARNEKLNRSVQSFLYGVLQDDNELAAKRSLAVLGELWRRGIWRDARTVNVIASAAFHRSPSVCLAALKFFLGQDAAAAAAAGESDDEGDGDAAAATAAASSAAMPTKMEFYKANKQGTSSSKKRKKAKLARAMASVKRHARRDASAASEGFAAVHLLHDPQAFAERLFARLQGSREKWEARAAMMAVASRVIGVHKLLVLNFYPFLQKYIAPHTRDVTQVLAALVQSTHELVPPESLAPVLRQLVDQFVHDRARPEVIVVGLKTVREVCLRCPLLMGPELLQDLAAYKKFRDKEVASAARSVIGLFRDLNPALLAKRDRGRGADTSSGPAAYGARAVASRVDGAELLQAALERGEEYCVSDDGGGGGGGDSDSEGEGGSEGEDGSEDGSGGEGESSGAEEEGEEGGSSEGEEGGGGSEEGAAVAAGEELSGGEEEEEPESSGGGSGSGEWEEEGAEEGGAAAAARADGAAAAPRRAPQPGSLAELKRRLAAKQAAQGAGAAAGPEGEAPLDPSLPIEMQRILTEEDFKHIRQLKRKAMVEAAMARHGLKSLTKAKARRLAEAAEEEAEEALAIEAARAGANEAAVAPDELAGRKKRARDKAGRLASVLEGREGREEFGSRSSRKKQKTGSKSEREKQRAKQMPIAARIAQLRNRAASNKARRSPKNFKGHIRGRT